MDDVIVRACSTRGKGAEGIKGFGGKSRRKQNIRKTQTKGKDNTQVNLTEIRWTELIWLRIRASGGLLYIR
jgi:hypothetical protein